MPLGPPLGRSSAIPLSKDVSQALRLKRSPPERGTAQKQLHYFPSNNLFSLLIERGGCFISRRKKATTMTVTKRTSWNREMMKMTSNPRSEELAKEMWKVSEGSQHQPNSTAWWIELAEFVLSLSSNVSKEELQDEIQLVQEVLGAELIEEREDSSQEDAEPESHRSLALRAAQTEKPIKLWLTFNPENAGYQRADFKKDFPLLDYDAILARFLDYYHDAKPRTNWMTTYFAYVAEAQRRALAEREKNSIETDSMGLPIDPAKRRAMTGAPSNDYVAQSQAARIRAEEKFRKDYPGRPLDMWDDAEWEKMKREKETS